MVNRLAEDRALKQWLFNSLSRLSAPNMYSYERWSGATPDRSDAAPPGPVRATWRLLLRAVDVDRRLQSRAEMCLGNGWGAVG